MAETKRTPIQPTATWTDIAAADVSLQGIPVILTGASAYASQVVFGGATPPAANDAYERLGFNDVLGPATTNNIWVRADNPTFAKIAVSIGD